MIIRVFRAQIHPGKEDESGRFECTMTDSAGKDVSRCLMIAAHAGKETNRATDWPPDLMALFPEKTPEPGGCPAWAA